MSFRSPASSAIGQGPAERAWSKSRKRARWCARGSKKQASVSTGSGTPSGERARRRRSRAARRCSRSRGSVNATRTLVSSRITLAVRGDGGAGQRPVARRGGRGLHDFVTAAPYDENAMPYGGCSLPRDEGRDGGQLEHETAR